MTEAAHLTGLLRRSQDPLFRQLNALLRARGVDPDVDVLADLFTDDVDQEFGVVVTTDRRVFTFVLARVATPAEAELDEWQNITTWWDATPYSRVVSEALELIRQPSESRSRQK